MSQKGPKPIVLVICDYYLPGFESGGAMRTLVNMVERLGETFDFRIITRDHDGPHDLSPYDSVRINEWNQVGNAAVYYVSQDTAGPSKLKRLIDEVRPAAIYLNSFFSPFTVYVLCLQKLKRIPPIPIVLAPEGEFSPGALSLKALKKKVYLSAAKLLRLFTHVGWKAASESERLDIIDVMDGNCDISIAPNMPPKAIYPSYAQCEKPEKIRGSASMVFLSRFMRKKNFNWLLSHLVDLKDGLTIDICGPLEEADYWSEALDLIEKLSPDIRIRSIGSVSHDQVAATLAKYHFFVLPTLGENFGHVFIEALASGCPLIISDRTPWRQLEEKGVGWDLSLDDPADWISVLRKCIDMDGEQYSHMSAGSRQFAVNWLSDPSIEASNRHVLQAAIDRGMGH